MLNRLDINAYDFLNNGLIFNPLYHWNCISLLYSLHTLALLHVEHVKQNNKNNSIINTKLLNVLIANTTLTFMTCYKHFIVIPTLKDISVKGMCQSCEFDVCLISNMLSKYTEIIGL